MSAEIDDEELGAEGAGMLKKMVTALALMPFFGFASLALKLTAKEKKKRRGRDESPAPPPAPRP